MKHRVCVLGRKFYQTTQGRGATRKERDELQDLQKEWKQRVTEMEDEYDMEKYKYEQALAQVERPGEFERLKKAEISLITESYKFKAEIRNLKEELKQNNIIKELGLTGMAKLCRLVQEDDDSVSVLKRLHETEARLEDLKKRTGEEDKPDEDWEANQKVPIVSYPTTWSAEAPCEPAPHVPDTEDIFSQCFMNRVPWIRHQQNCSEE